MKKKQKLYKTMIKNDYHLTICKYEIITELKQELKAEVTVDEDIALVAVVGRNMVNKSGLCGAIFQTMGEEKINVKLLAQGPQELNIIIGVSKEDYDKICSKYLVGDETLLLDHATYGRLSALFEVGEVPRKILFGRDGEVIDEHYTIDTSNMPQ